MVRSEFKMNTFGKRLEALLQEKSLSQRELSKLCGVSEVTVSRYVHGDRSPTSEILAKISDVLDVSSDYLLGRTKNQNIKLVQIDEVTLHILKDKDVDDMTIKEMKRAIEQIKKHHI